MKLNRTNVLLVLFEILRRFKIEARRGATSGRWRRFDTRGSCIYRLNSGRRRGALGGGVCGRRGCWGRSKGFTGRWSK